MVGLGDGTGICPGVVPVLVGPLQVLLTILPGLLLALAGGIIGLLKPTGMKNAVRLLWRQKVSVLTLAVLGVVAYFGIQQFWPRSQAAVIGTAVEGGDWPTARGDLRRCGAVPGTKSPTRRTLVWSHREGMQGFWSSPAVVGNRVYVASVELGISQSGRIYCFDADTGKVIWSNAPDDYRPTFSSPVIAGDYLVCGEGLHYTRDARIVCLDRTDEGKGKVLWTFRTHNHVECTPVIANDRVYVGAGDDGYYCLDLKPGPDGAAKVLWHLPGEKYPDAETSLAVHDGKVYAGLGKNGAALVVLDAMTGAELRRLPMPYPVFSPPSIADGKLYLGMGNGDYVNEGSGGEVRCLDVKSLTTLWSFPLPNTVLGAVAVKEDKLYFGCSDQHLYCLNRDGTLHKKRNLFQPIKTSPAVTDEHVFVVNETGLLLALDRNTLQPIWDFQLATEGGFYSSPVVAKGHVYVGTKQDGLLCVGKPASSKQTPIWASPLGGPGKGGNSDSSGLPQVPELIWLYAPAKSSIGKRSVAPALWNDHLYVVRTEPPHGLACLPLAKEGRELPAPLWTFPIDEPITGDPVVSGRTVAIVAGEPGSPGRRLLLIDRGKGTLIAERSVGADATGLLTASLHQFLIQDRGNYLTSLDSHGIEQWSVKVGKLATAPSVNETMIVVPTASPNEVLAIDRGTGALLWSQSLADAPIATPLLEKRTMLIATRNGIESRSLTNGSQLAQWDGASNTPTGELVSSGLLLLFVNELGELVVFDIETGKSKARIPNVRRRQTPLVSRNIVIYHSPEGNLLSCDISKREPAPELWFDLAAVPGLTAPGWLLLKDSRIFTVQPGRGLACLGGAP